MVNLAAKFLCLRISNGNRIYVTAKWRSVFNAPSYNKAEDFIKTTMAIG